MIFQLIGKYEKFGVFIEIIRDPLKRPPSYNDHSSVMTTFPYSRPIYWLNNSDHLHIATIFPYSFSRGVCRGRCRGPLCFPLKTLSFASFPIEKFVDEIGSGFYLLLLFKSFRSLWFGTTYCGIVLSMQKRSKNNFSIHNKKKRSRFITLFCRS